MDKVNVPIAIEDNTKLDLGHQHITTNDWFGLNVSYVHEMVPGEKIDVSMETLTRMNAMPCPTFGRASEKHFAAFVPSRTVWRQWTDFITDTVHIGSDGSNTGLWSDSVPTVSNENLCQAFIQASYPISAFTADENFVNSIYLLEEVTDYVQNSGLTAYDIKYYDNQSPARAHYYNYTYTGRRAISLLEQLGYKLYWQYGYNATYNALPLLAVAKCWCDWMFPNQYVSTSGYNTLMALLNKDNAANYALSVPDVTTILEYCTFTFYDQDFFTAAWDAPNSPRSDLHSTFMLRNLDTLNVLRGTMSTPGTVSYIRERGYVTNSDVAIPATGTNVFGGNRVGGADAPFISPVIGATTSSTGATPSTLLPTPISEYLLHSLHALTDFLQRNKIAGGRALDRYLLRYGKALSSEKLNRSVFISRDAQPIQIGDVMSTSDTEDITKGFGSRIGDYAGKGLSYGKNHYSYSTDEFGYFIIFTTIIPNAGYVDGVDPIVQRKSRTQFYIPEFDSLGSEPISKETLWVPQYGDLSVINNTYNLQEGIFGFCPRYAGYKTSFDKLTGNFRLCSMNGTNPTNPMEFNAADSWHLNRRFDYTSFGGAYDINGNVVGDVYVNVTHNPDFLKGQVDGKQYNRIFYTNDVRTPDQFTTIHNFEIASYFPGKSLYDTYEFEQEGRLVKTDVGGVRVN